MTNIYMKRWSVSLVIRKMQIKTTVRQQLTPVRAAATQHEGQVLVGARSGHGSPCHGWGCKRLQPVVKRCGGASTS